MVEFHLKPLEVVDGRLPCPACKTPADVTEDVVIVIRTSSEEPVWECPKCHHRFVDLREA